MKINMTHTTIGQSQFNEDKHGTHCYRPISMKINMTHTTIGQSQ